MTTDPYFEDLNPNFYVNVLRASAFLSSLSFILGVYLILWRTPSRFGEYKWFMLNILISAYIFDIYTSLIYSPITLFPILYACTLGPIKYLGKELGGVLSYDLFIVLFGVANIAIIVAIAFRFAILKGYSRYFCSKIGIFIIGVFELTAALPVVFARHIAIGNPVDNRNKVIEMYPHARHVLENEYCTGVSVDYNKFTWVFLAATFLSFFCAIPIALYLILKCFSMLNDFASKMSTVTRRLHRQLLYSLICQFSVPCATLILPFLILSILSLFGIGGKGHYDQYLVILGTFHSFGNTLMMVVTIKPYRNTFLSALGKRVEPSSWLYTTRQSALAPINPSTHSQFSVVYKK